MPRKPNLEARERILVAAHHLFFDRGYEGVSMDEVAGAAGIKKANLFHYYPTKEQLGLAVLGFASVRGKAQVCSQLEGAARDPVKAVEKVFDEAAAAMKRAGCKGGCFMGNLAQELSGQNETLRKELAEYFQFWGAELAQVFEQARREGYFTPRLRPRAAADAIIALLEGAFLVSKARKETAPLETAKEMALHYLKSYRA